MCVFHVLTQSLAYWGFKKATLLQLHPGLSDLLAVVLSSPCLLCGKSALPSLWQGALHFLQSRSQYNEQAIKGSSFCLEVYVVIVNI